MLRSYTAQLQGSQVIWIDTPPPAQAQSQRVVVVIEEPSAASSRTHVSALLARARGSLGQLSRERVLSQLATLREDWSAQPPSAHPPSP
jgi:hypothetical protein